MKLPKKNPEDFIREQIRGNIQIKKGIDKENRELRRLLKEMEGDKK